MLPKKWEQGAEDKNRGGRPSKLTAELCDRLERIVDDWNPLANLNYDEPRRNNLLLIISQYLGLCTKDNLAAELGIDKTTLYEFEAGGRKSHKASLSRRFSNSIKKWETKRNALHMKMRPFFSKAEPTWIFLSKNFNQFTDTVQVNRNETVNHNVNINKTEVKVEINNANAGSVLDILAECGYIPQPDKEAEH